MTMLQETIRSLGGVAARRELLASGHDDDEIRMAADYRSIERVRNGWYVLPGGAPHVLRAWRVGGRLACVSALNHWGYALPDNGNLHVCVAAHSVRLRHPEFKRVRLRDRDVSNLITHWDDARSMDQLPSGRRVAVSVAAALDQLLRCPRAVEAAAMVPGAGLRMPVGERNR